MKGDSDPPRLPDHRCLPEFDHGAWDWLRPPAQSFLVCASPRTGSTWVCEELGFRGLGEPLEYFNPVYVHYLCWRWQCVNLAQYRMMLWRMRSTASGVFGMKILGMHMDTLTDDVFDALTLASRAPADDPAERARLRRQQAETVAPSCTYVWLRRREKSEQAISWWVAEQTGLWMQKLERDSRQLGELRYNFAAIEDFRVKAERDELRWRFFFEANAIEPITIDYEDLCRDPEAQLGRLAEQLGGSYSPTTERPELRNHVQSNTATAGITIRYRHDRARLFDEGVSRS